MRKLELALGGGLNGLPIGSPVDVVRGFFGGGHKPFKRAPESDETDFWPDEGVLAYYDRANLLEAIEFSAGSDPTLEGSSLMRATLDEAIDQLRQFDPELCIEKDGATSVVLGMAVWSSTGKPDQPVMSVITFGPGYYD